MKIYILLLFIVGFVQASPKRPFRDETPEDELNKDTSEEKDAEQEIAFGVFTYYDEDEEESELPAENRKRPNFPVFSEGSSFGSGGSNKPTGPPAFVIQNKDNDSEDTETLPYDVIERGYVSLIRLFLYFVIHALLFFCSNTKFDPILRLNGYARKKLRISMMTFTRIGG